MSPRLTRHGGLRDSLYWLLLGLYPAEIRRKYRQDMAELFSDLCEGERHRRGRPGVVWITVRAYLEVPLAAFAAHRRGWRPALREWGSDRPTPPTGPGPVRNGPGPWLESVSSDFRFGLRALRKSPGVASIVILTLGLGIGTNTTVFALVNRVLLQPLPFPDIEQLVAVWDVQPGYRGRPSVSVPEFLDWEREGDHFQALMAQVRTGANLRTRGGVERVSVARIAGDYLGVLGLGPAFGRGFTRQEVMSSEPVVMVSEGFWASHFAGEPSVVGETLELDGEAFTVIGVMAEAADRISGPNTGAWIPLSREQWAAPRENHFLRVYGRLRPGISLRTAEEQTRTLAVGLQESQGTDHGVDIEPLDDLLVGARQAGLLLLFAAAVAILLIICGNLASLFLVRSMARRQEFAVRSALGAMSGRLGRQLLTETAVIGVLGGVVGLGISYVATRLLVASSSDVAALMIEDWMDYRVVTFTFVLALGAGLVFGVTPARGIRKQEPALALREGGGTGAGGGRSALEKRRIMVAGQVAVSFMLLASATLLLRSLGNFLHHDPGWAREGLLLFRVALPVSAYPDSGTLNPFQRRLLERLGNIPGVDHVSAGSHIPLTGGGSNGTFEIEGRDWPEGERHYVYQRAIGPEFFETLGIRVVRGREFTEADEAGAPFVTVISTDMADRYWSDSDPLGQRIRIWGRFAEIVGVVAEVSNSGLGQPARFGTTYVPMYQVQDRRNPWLAIRTAGDPLALVGAARAEVASLDPGLPLYSISTMEDLIDRSLAEGRITVNMLLGFGLACLLLAALGVYGVTAYAVQRRTREIGIRIALGAGGMGLVRKVLKEEMRVLGLGLLAGILLALGLGQLLSSSLYGVSPHDPLAFGVTVAVLATVGFLAVLVPAAKAIGVDPISALRAE